MAVSNAARARVGPTRTSIERASCLVVTLARIAGGGILVADPTIRERLRELAEIRKRDEFDNAVSAARAALEASRGSA